jgi:branched-chain amino acid aminotransferase
MQTYSIRDFPALAERLRRPFQEQYFAMFSSLYGGLVTDPALMLLPLDDHMVHRGDGIFEAVKAVQGRIYNLAAHVARLNESARGLHLRVPVSDAELTALVVETVRAGGRPDCMIRLFVSRGPGGYSVNPYECPQPQLYIVVTSVGTPFMRLHPEGARVRTSRIPAKTAAMAVIKNCNYAPNVLMKKEALDAGVDFVAGFDENGHLTEGAVENMGIVTQDRRLLFPKLDRILPGTTMLRVIDLARALVRGGRLQEVAFRDIPRHDVVGAAEFLITGTTINVAAAVEFDGLKIGDGRPGPVYQALAAALEEDTLHNAALLTPAL